MKLKDLMGQHVLDAVDFDTIKNDKPAIQVTCRVCYFRLDGVVYTAVEDPKNNYSSGMKELRIDNNRNMVNIFPPVEVSAQHKTRIKQGIKTMSLEASLLELIDLETNKLLLVIGTENGAKFHSRQQLDYYPIFIADFYPRR